MEVVQAVKKMGVEGSARFDFDGVKPSAFVQQQVNLMVAGGIPKVAAGAEVSVEVVFQDFIDLAFFATHTASAQSINDDREGLVSAG